MKKGTKVEAGELLSVAALAVLCLIVAATSASDLRIVGQLSPTNQAHFNLSLQDAFSTSTYTYAFSTSLVPNAWSDEAVRLGETNQMLFVFSMTNRIAAFFRARESSEEDFDGDELSNIQEFEYGTDAENPDTDGDEMWDGWEVQKGFSPTNASDGREDRDSDEAENFKEFLFQADPDVADSDVDGMQDGWEIRYGLNPTNNDAAGDLDSDGLLNLDEYKRGTEPTDPDSDNDGISDGPSAVGAIFAGPDPNPLTPAPGNLPLFHIIEPGKTIALTEDSHGRPVVAWKAPDAQGNQQVYVMQWFGLASDVAGAWAELNGTWECFGSSASGSGVTLATNDVRRFDLAVGTNGWPAVCWSQALGYTGAIYYLAWDGTNWAGATGAATSEVAEIDATYATFSVLQTEPEFLYYFIWAPWDDCSLAFDLQNRPYVAYILRTNVFADTSSIRLRYHDGTNWVALGSSTNASGLSGHGSPHCFPQVVIGPDNKPVVGYFRWTGSPVGQLYAKKWNPATTNWDTYGGNPVDDSGYATEIYDLGVNCSNHVLATYQRVATAPLGTPWKYPLWLRKSSGGSWAGYGGSASGVGLARTNITYIQTRATSLFIQSNTQAGVAWIQWGGLDYTWLPAREGTNWAALGYSMTNDGINLSGRTLGWVASTPADGSPVVAYTEQMGGDASGPHKLVLRQYQADTDGDGLSDNYEIQNGLNQNAADTDADGLTDWEEWVFYGTTATTNDTDADGLLDGEEVLGTLLGYPTDALSNDSDGDGILDGCDLLPNSPDGDQDGDGLPDDIDSDDDNDGWSDDYETGTSGTDPANADSDCDGIPDSLDTGGPDTTPPLITILEPEEGATL